MTRREAAFIRQARVGHLATVDAQGQPLNLPFCFAFDGASLYSPIDEKPKTAAPRELKRVRNIRANPRVSVAVHRYHDDDWSRLAHVIVQGEADVLTDGSCSAAAPEVPAVPGHGPGPTAHHSDPGGAVHPLGPDLTPNRGALTSTLYQRKRERTTPPPP